MVSNHAVALAKAGRLPRTETVTATVLAAPARPFGVSPKTDFSRFSPRLNS